MDPTESPAVGPSGWHKRTVTRDDAGRPVRESWFDAADQPQEVDWGYAQYIQTWDRYGQAGAERFLDASNREVTPP